MVLLVLWYSMQSREKCLGFEPRCVVGAWCSVHEQREVCRFEPRCGVVGALVFHAEQREVFCSALVFHAE